MSARYEIIRDRSSGLYVVLEICVSGKRRRITHASTPFSCLSHALFFGLPYGKGSKLRRRPELEGGRAVQVWA